MKLPLANIRKFAPIGAHTHQMMGKLIKSIKSNTIKHRLDRLHSKLKKGAGMAWFLLYKMQNDYVIYKQKKL